MSVRILIVDDEPRVARLLRRALQEDRVEVDVCSDPDRALDLLETSGFDIVLTDLKMKGIDGLELLRRAKVIHPSCEVILMTGYATKQTAREAREFGAMDVLQKPFSVEKELRPLILNLLDRASARPEEEPRGDRSKDGSG